MSASRTPFLIRIFFFCLFSPTIFLDANRVPFSAASSATPFKRNFKLVYLSENNEQEEIELKLARPRIAISLYRAITEKHAFYSCETVGSDVTKQFIRDFKVCKLCIHYYSPRRCADILCAATQNTQITVHVCLFTI